jgi:hypothetical protein
MLVAEKRGPLYQNGKLLKRQARNEAARMQLIQGRKSGYIHDEQGLVKLWIAVLSRRIWLSLIASDFH